MKPRRFGSCCGAVRTLCRREWVVFFALLGCANDETPSGLDGSAETPAPTSEDASYPLGDASPPRDGAEGPLLCQGGAASRHQPLIDDFEDGDGIIVAADGRNGHWLVRNDGSGQQSPAAGTDLLPEAVPFQDASVGDGGLSYVIHSSGSGFSGWGAAVTFDFHENQGVPCVYDASYYQGISFLAKGTGKLRLEVSVPATVPVAEGGICAGEGCDNRHGFAVSLGSDWKRYAVSFLQLAQQPGFGQPASFDPARVLGVFFRAEADQQFEFWIDDVRFFPDPGLPDAGIDGAVVDASDAGRNGAHDE